MKVEHELTMGSVCPMDGTHDFYTVIFRLGRMVPVENLKKSVADFAVVTMFQEEITQRLADGFECEVETHGIHSGVKTKVVCHADSCERVHENGETTGKSRPKKSRRATYSSKRK